MEKVSVDTVTQLTIAFSSNAPAGPLPTAQQMIDDIRARFKADIQSLTKSMQAAPASPKSAFAISRNKKIADLQKFEEIVGNIPKGFQLAPVWFSRITQQENERTQKQYLSYVRPRFLRFLAENHADELAALGISQRGIERMKCGSNPIDTAGKMYAVNVDHIIERAGGGAASLKKEADPNIPGGKPTYIVNHFNNFILLPLHIHELKNKLNMLQNKDRILPGESDWVLMIVPEASKPGYSGYVAQPQGDLQTPNRKAGLSMLSTNPLDMTASAVFEAHIVLDNADEGVEFMQPVLDDVAHLLTTAFNRASRPKQDMRGLREFYEGKSFTRLRKKAEAFPSETNKLRLAMQSIDSGIKARYYNTRDAKRSANSKNPQP